MTQLCIDAIRRAVAGRAPRALASEFPGKASSVLVPLIGREGGADVLFVKRRDDLPVHAGEYSFPGGRAEKDDADALATALRETEEEIAHPRGRVQPLGELDETWTYTGFRIRPFVGVLAPPYEFTPQKSEIDRVVVLPLAPFMEPGMWKKVVFPFPVPDYIPRGLDVHEVFVDGHRIWGVTARILRNFLTVCTGTDPASM